jgi:hypothetical protein
MVLLPQYRFLRASAGAGGVCHWGVLRTPRGESHVAPFLPAQPLLFLG